MDLDKQKIAKDIEDSFSRLSGRLLELSEGFFKENIDQKKWNGFRKLTLDMINTESRYILSKLEGKNYYKIVPIKRKDGLDG